MLKDLGVRWRHAKLTGIFQLKRIISDKMTTLRHRDLVISARRTSAAYTEETSVSLVGANELFELRQPV